MSCNYYFYCQKCKEESGSINFNGPMESARFLYSISNIVNCISFLKKNVDCVEISSCTINMNVGIEFYRKHQKCYNEKPFLLSNEWGEALPALSVAETFGFGQKVKKKVSDRGKAIK